MGLLVQTALLVAGIVLLSCMPIFFGAAKKYSKAFFLTGTGAMFGLCFFDLLPDAFDRGGKLSLTIIAFIFILYTLMHGFSHKHDSEQPFLVLFVSLLVHCFASGMFLTISSDLSVKTAQAVFIALCIHKSYEALMFSFILVDRQFSRRRKILFLSLYASSLPLGVAITWLFKDSFSERVAMVLSSIAVGSLIGCLVFDFLFPSLRKIRARRLELVFIAVGLVLTQIVLRGL